MPQWAGGQGTRGPARGKRSRDSESHDEAIPGRRETPTTARGYGYRADQLAPGRPASLRIGLRLSQDCRREPQPARTRAPSAPGPAVTPGPPGVCRVGRSDSDGGCDGRECASGSRRGCVIKRKAVRSTVKRADLRFGSAKYINQHSMSTKPKPGKYEHDDCAQEERRLAIGVT